MKDCVNCNVTKVVGSIFGTLTLGAILFFSCGKAEEKKDAAAGTGDKGDVEIHLTFEAYADNTVETFNVYAGTSKDTLELADGFTTTNTDFDHANPEITLFSAGNTVLTTLLGGQGCFQLKAVKADVESDGSNVVCTDL